VFGGRYGQPEHLARHSQADLFLDTLPYNAHTTASDALWTGLPIVTCTGSTFAGRVASSLLMAIGLPELVTRTLQEYEALALRLAGDPSALAAIRSKLSANRETMPLFDIRHFARYLETAYATMYERHMRGLPQGGFAVMEPK
jgi:predicted O-linked N-acetylglucosamine transferase (SPINDLY family)